MTRLGEGEACEIRRTGDDAWRYYASQTAALADSPGLPAHLLAGLLDAGGYEARRPEGFVVKGRDPKPCEVQRPGETVWRYYARQRDAVAAESPGLSENTLSALLNNRGYEARRPTAEVVEANTGPVQYACEVLHPGETIWRPYATQSAAVADSPDLDDALLFKLLSADGYKARRPEGFQERNGRGYRPCEVQRPGETVWRYYATQTAALAANRGLSTMALSGLLNSRGYEARVPRRPTPSPDAPPVEDRGDVPMSDDEVGPRVGLHVEVYWDGDGIFHAGTITDQNAAGEFEVTYVGGSYERLRLAARPLAAGEVPAVGDDAPAGVAYRVLDELPAEELDESPPPDAPPAEELDEPMASDLSDAEDLDEPMASDVSDAEDLSEGLAPAVSAVAELFAPLIDAEWRRVLGPLATDSRVRALASFVAAARRGETRVYPRYEDTFAALNACPPSALKVCILAQDPYHGPGQAHGLAFSMAAGADGRFPPSLGVIFDELVADQGVAFAARPPHEWRGDLTNWALRGVLLLNSVLTVPEADANGHKNQGWEFLTGEVIRYLNDHVDFVVFLAMGQSAQALCRGVDQSKHVVISTAHPSPRTTGFRGCRCFSLVNAALKDKGMSPVDWRLDDRPGLIPTAEALPRLDGGLGAAPAPAAPGGPADRAVLDPSRHLVRKYLEFANVDAAERDEQQAARRDLVSDLDLVDDLRHSTIAFCQEGVYQCDSTRRVTDAFVTNRMLQLLSWGVTQTVTTADEFASLEAQLATHLARHSASDGDAKATRFLQDSSAFICRAVMRLRWHLLSLNSPEVARRAVAGTSAGRNHAELKVFVFAFLDYVRLQRDYTFCARPSIDSEFELTILVSRKPCSKGNHFAGMYGCWEFFRSLGASIEKVTCAADIPECVRPDALPDHLDAWIIKLRI